ncbi:MAG TPA: wax ester/triacylglycerol synthase family O-acyltransferase [Solirubrobacteraceae bacterium]|jgi:WS/DGAT/MGAT family acyltransferase|nr:wax ester/triacylglycerol synthase family O-acyltransferase [Solirubrobacteraceae bacterium]
MAQRHLDRLTAVDASFLHQEGPNSHMHIGGLTILEGPAPPMEDFLEQIRKRLHLVPRYRHKLAHTALDSGRPVWVDDPSFNLEFHVRHTALPAPGSWEQLRNLTARIFSQALDRSKPLWEMWLIEGLGPDTQTGSPSPNGHFALISKTHHSLIDGIAGVDLATVLFDVSPDPPPLRHSGRPWKPHPEPDASELVAVGLRGAVRAGVEMAGAALGALTRPERTIERAREAAEGVGEIVWAGLNPAPATPLNVVIGPHRRFVGVAAKLEDFKLVKNELGGTVNDVVLTVVTGALRAFLLARGVRTDGVEMRALVPVSVRTVGERHEAGNRIAAMRGPLPVYIADPLQRLRFVRHAMDGLKESKQALGAEAIAGAQNFAPPTILAQASRLNFSTRLFNVIVTNVPGPQFPLYVLGRRMERVFPVAFLPQNHALAVAIMSYDGEMNFGLLGDFDALPDIDSIGESIASELATLVELAQEHQGQDADAASNGGVSSPKRTSRPRSSSPATTGA